MPPGVALEYGGQHASQQQSFRELLAVLTLAVGAVLLVLVAQFNALRGPLAIVLAIPVGLTGALVALAVTGVPLNVSSFMGLILLVGLIVKNGILLFDAAEALRRKGEAPRDAVVGAGRLRLRPILMTTLCTLAGLVPLALGLGAGAELQQPLAIAVIGGLIVSTGVTLLLLPVGLEAVRALQVRGPAKAAGWSGLALVAVLAGCPASRLEAQATDSVPTAPRSPHVIRWYEAAAAVGGVALLSVVDEPIQDWIQDHRSEGTDDAAGIFRREGEPIWWGGITVGVTAAGLIIGDDDVTAPGCGPSPLWPPARWRPPASSISSAAPGLRKGWERSSSTRSAPSRTPTAPSSASRCRRVTRRPPSPSPPRWRTRSEVRSRTSCSTRSPPAPPGHA